MRDSPHMSMSSVVRVSAVLLTVLCLTQEIPCGIASAAERVSQTPAGKGKPGKDAPASGKVARPTGTDQAKTRSSPRQESFLQTLEHAPFPYAGKYDDSQTDFFDYTDLQSGERYHTNRYGVRFSEKEHYADGRVLFHIPAHFKPDQPFFLVIFFHAINTDVTQSMKDYGLDRQLDATGVNAILVAPQLARNAADSSPGKFFQPGVFKAFMEEAAGVLAAKIGEAHRERLQQAPILLTAFSGGYKSVAFVLDRGGVPSRIAGVFLMDALYEDVDKFGAWINGGMGEGFFVSLHTEGACEKNAADLANRARNNGVRVLESWPSRISSREAYFTASKHTHRDVPILGPPKNPLASLLRASGLPRTRE